MWKAKRWVVAEAFFFTFGNAIEKIVSHAAQLLPADIRDQDNRQRLNVFVLFETHALFNRPDPVARPEV